jgi:glycerol-3-phosphate dehydrogenase
MKVEEIVHDDQGKVSGVKVKDRLTDNTLTVNSKLVINTAGPWSDLVNKLDKKIDHKPHKICFAFSWNDKDHPSIIFSSVKISGLRNFQLLTIND